MSKRSTSPVTVCEATSDGFCGIARTLRTVMSGGGCVGEGRASKDAKWKDAIATQHARGIIKHEARTCGAHSWGLRDTWVLGAVYA